MFDFFFFFTIFLGYHLLAWTSASVIELNQTTFEELVLSDASTDHWFIAFYAPWCHHCKKLYPLLEDLSNYLEVKHQAEPNSPKISVGKIDATSNHQITAKFGIDKFPRIWYKKENITGIYDGPRSSLGFQQFVDRFNDPIFYSFRTTDPKEFTIPVIHPYHNVTFVLQVFCDLDLVDNCSPFAHQVAQAFRTVADRVHLHATLAIVQHPSSTKRTIKEESEVSFCKFTSVSNLPFRKLVFASDASQQLTQEDQFYCLDLQSLQSSSSSLLSSSLQSFIERNNYPFLSLFDNHNFKILAHLNKTMILAIVDESKEITSHAILSQLQQNYLQLLREHPDRAEHFHEQYSLGYLDGRQWKQFVRHHDAFIPSLLVIDHQDERHAVLKLPSSAKATENYPAVIRKWMVSVLVEESIDMSDTVPPGIIRKMFYRFKKYFPYSILILLLPSLLLILSFKAFPYPAIRKGNKRD